METWETYENAAMNVVRHFMDELGLESVADKKQDYQGKATSHNLEVAAYRKGDRKLVVFECKDRTSRNVEKGMMREFAYIIRDLDASPGYYFSRRSLGKGAQEIADLENVGHMKFNIDENTGTQVVEFLNKSYAINAIDLRITGC